MNNPIETHISNYTEEISLYETRRMQIFEYCHNRQIHFFDMMELIEGVHINHLC